MFYRREPLPFETAIEVMTRFRDAATIICSISDRGSDSFKGVVRNEFMLPTPDSRGRSATRPHRQPRLELPRLCAGTFITLAIFLTID